MESRVSEWLSMHGYPNQPPPFVALQWNPPNTVTVQVAYMRSEDVRWQAALAEELGRAWGVAVEFQAYQWPESAIDRIRRIWEMSHARFLTLVPAHCLTIGDAAGIDCVFPNRVAADLFEKWGGEARLRQFWPDMPAWSHKISTPSPAWRDPVVPVAAPATSGREPSPRIGRGVPRTTPVSLRNLSDSGEVTVLGKVFGVDNRVARDGAVHWTWSITDNEGAIRVKFSERRGTQQSLEPFGESSWIKVRGVLEVDKFSEERVIRIKDAGVVPAPLAVHSDTSRIELHAHSKMSTMDGLMTPGDLFRLAKEVGHTAVAIVDHGVVQTFPELEQLSKSTGVQAIYGIEVNMVDDAVASLTGPQLVTPWPDTPIVVVDVETTGLSPRIHDIIEIGAVKIVGRRITDHFHRMVRPERAISQTTMEITGIKEIDVANAPSAAEVMGEFLEFAQGCILAAHNARFDYGFITSAVRRHLGHEIDFPLLDSLNLARTSVPGLKSYGLNGLTQHFKVPLTQHHRALDDAEATAEVLIKLLTDSEGNWMEEAELRSLKSLVFNIGRPQPVVVLVKSQEGIEPLYRLVSESHLETFYRVPRVRRSALEKGRDYWYLGSPIHGGEISEALLRGDGQSHMEQLIRFYDYWEVTPPDGLGRLCQDEFLASPEAVQVFLQELIMMGRAGNKPVPAVSDAHYLRPEDKVFRDILAATAKGELHDASDALHLRTGDEMREAFQWLSSDDRDYVVDSSPNWLLQGIEVVKPVPDGLFAPTLDEALTVIQTVPRQQAEAMYGTPLPAIVAERLEKEIRSITDNGFSSIYYIAHRLVKKSLDDGYLVGSRGSVGSSLVATLLQITEVNPLPPHYRCPKCQYSEFVDEGAYHSGFDLPSKTCPRCGQALLGDGQDIPFETFLGFEGDKVPDIDLNFSGEYQSIIHRYTEELFGQGHVFRAGTITTVAQKTAYGLVRAWARDAGRELSMAEIDWLASGITGVKRTTGQHPGGLMVVPRDESIYRFCPVQHPADDHASDVVTTHFDYHAIEGRLLKLDLLGHDDPTAIRMLEELTGVSARDIPFQDAETMALFRDTSSIEVSPDAINSPVGSLGIPEFGTQFVRRMLIETRPATFAELIRISGLSHGTEVWTNNAQELIRQKLATLSDVIATRDDIMIYLLSRGLAPKVAFGISESVRKGKGLKPEQEQAMRQNQVPDWYIASCRKISYLFPKAHAAAYVMMGWRIAWFKVHHPLAFYATYFSRHMDDFDPQVAVLGVKKVNQTISDIEAKGNDATAKERGQISVLELVREMLARGYRFYPVDLMESPADRFAVRDDGLLIPFAALPGLGMSAAENITQARREGPFLSIDDLRRRAHLTKSVIDLLRSQGALDGLGETSQLAFF
ncbi:MAG: PolC-type DNA polymerase III [Firmicutes bacterium]|nr:PolC-type DNA polymerase III [Bacillota bacterium]